MIFSCSFYIRDIFLLYDIKCNFSPAYLIFVSLLTFAFLFVGLLRYKIILCVKIYQFFAFLLHNFKSYLGRFVLMIKK